MNTFDVVILAAVGAFAFSGWRSGLLKKLFATLLLVIAIIVAAKNASDLGRSVFAPLGFTPGASTVIAFLCIVLGFMLVQAIVYHMLFKKAGEGTWNKVGGMVFGLFEGVLLTSVVLLFLSIYFQVPSEETKAGSRFYKPTKNFAPLVFDTMNNIFPESRDFYEEIFSLPHR